jgi:hypothetical protein
LFLTGQDEIDRWGARRHHMCNVRVCLRACVHCTHVCVCAWCVHVRVYTCLCTWVWGRGQVREHVCLGARGVHERVLTGGGESARPTRLGTRNLEILCCRLRPPVRGRAQGACAICGRQRSVSLAPAAAAWAAPLPLKAAPPLRPHHLCPRRSCRLTTPPRPRPRHCDVTHRSAAQTLYERMKSLGPAVPELIILPVYRWEAAVDDCGL